MLNEQNGSLRSSLVLVPPRALADVLNLINICEVPQEHSGVPLSATVAQHSESLI